MTALETFWLSPITDRYQLKPSDYLPLVFSPDYTVNRTLNKVSQYFGIPIEKIKSKSRKRELVICRQICFRIMKQKTRLSLKSIAEILGGRDHTTAIHSINTIENLMFSDNRIRNDVYAIEAMI